ncbi:MAG: AAA family ATPase, partial [Cutibacterium sp.]|nr:AAA family ATPase [Cutibacterium sp.]
DDPASAQRLERLNSEIADSQEKLRSLESRWEAEKAGLNRVGELKTQIDELRTKAEKFQREGDFGRASEILYGQIPGLEREMGAAAEAEEQTPRMVSEEVDAQDVAEVVSAWTGIPVGRMMEGEQEKLLSMEARLHERLIGQDRAVSSVADAVRRSRAGISDPNRPTGSFLFLGPTGVGKTELAKSLAQFLFDDETAMVRTDMSEYMEKYSVSRLVGAPPGYVGYEEGGQLTEAVRRRPYSVILLDEVEKAHPDVFNILLQVLDDGRLTDGQGRTVDFRNTILVLTSNLGSQFLSDPSMDDEAKREAVMGAVRQAFRPEFLNRLDDIVMFDPLSEADLTRIVDINLERLNARMAERRISVEVTPAGKQWLARTGLDPVYGARPLRRLIQTSVENPLARSVLSGEVTEGSTVSFDVDEDADKLVIV